MSSLFVSRFASRSLFFLSVISSLVLGMLCQSVASAQQDTDIRQMILDAVSQGQSTLTLPAGTFTVNQTITLYGNAQNLTITGQGQTHLIMTQHQPLFYLNGAKNITIDGISLDYDPLPFTQATITSIQDKTVTFEVHDGYPRLGPTYLTSKQLMIFDGQTRHWKWEQQDNYQTGLKMLSENTGQMTVNNPPDNMVVGDYVCLESRINRGFFLRGQAQDITFSNLTIYSAPGVGFDARRTQGAHHFDNVKIMRGPTPANATQPRLISTCADGINYANTRQGPVIENCDISWQGDDGVNLHGNCFPVLQVNEDGSFYTAVTWRPMDLDKIILPGDEARVLAQNNYAIAHRYIIESFEPLEDLMGITPQQVSAHYTGYAASEMGFPNYLVIRMKFQQGVPTVGQYVDVPAASCPNFVIRNNQFAHHKARGVRIMANHGVIENCRFEDTPQSAIYLGSEYSNWMESGWVSDIQVLNNQIQNVCRGGQAWSSYYYAPGAIALSGRCSRGNNLVAPGNQNVLIQNNTINDSGMSAIAILSGKDITLTNNTYTNVNTHGLAMAASAYGVQYQPVPVFVWPQATVNINIDSE